MFTSWLLGVPQKLCHQFQDTVVTCQLTICVVKHCTMGNFRVTKHSKEKLPKNSLFNILFFLNSSEKKVLTSTNKEATIQAKLAIFRLSCNPLLFVIIFDHTSVVKQDSAIFRPQPSLLSLSGLSKDYQIWSSPHGMSKSVKDIFPPNVLKDG